jgi:hypothetical protein
MCKKSKRNKLVFDSLQKSFARLGVTLCFKNKKQKD